jgi:DNA-binding SARP family transcriptional activator/tetratricopeptide (TPR) repeat protein
VRGELYFSLLGPVRGWREGRELDLGSPMQRLTLSVLLLNEGNIVSIEVLADALWGELVPRSASGIIRTYVHRLRRTLDAYDLDSVIKTRGGAYSLEYIPDSVDVGQFRTKIDQAEVMRRGGDLSGAADRLRGALDLWAGTPLAGTRGSYAESQRVRLEQMRVGALEQLFSVSLVLGRHSEIINDLRTSVSDEPLHERFRELLMLALYRSGRQAEALYLYEDVRKILRAELGADPGPALRALHQKILKADATLLLSGRDEDVYRTKASVTPRQLPADVGAFVGRQDSLDRLLNLADEADRSGSRNPVITIGGMAGVGKTTLAVHLAHRLSDSFPDGQLYADLRGFELDGAVLEPTEVLGGFLEALGVAPPYQPGDPAAKTALLRSLLAGRRVLILIDNARDSNQVLPLLPGSAGCFVIVTSRHELTGLVAVAGAYPVRLESLSPAEARHLLGHRIGMDRVAAEPEAAGKILDLCSRLPLALVITATRAAARPEFSLTAIAAELSAARGSLDAFVGSDRVMDIRAVFSWSFTALGYDAAMLFRLLAVHPDTDFGAAAAAALGDMQVPSIVPLLNELLAAHLIAERSPGRYSLHDLLRTYAHEELLEKVSPDKQWAALRRLLDHYLYTARGAARLYSTHPDSAPATVPDPNACSITLKSYEHAMKWFSIEYDCLLALLDRATEHGFAGHTWRLGWALRHFQDRHGYWHDLATTQRLCMEAADVLQDPEACAYAHRGLARAATRLGQRGDAQNHLEKALSLFAQLGDDLATAYTHRQFVGLLELDRDLGGALTHARAALSRFQAAGSRDGEAAVLNSVGYTLALLGKRSEGLSHCRAALALFEELGEEYGQAHSWDSLGYIHWILAEYDESVQCYSNAMRLFTRLGSREDEAEAFFRLGEAYLAADRVDDARNALRQTITILGDLGRPTSRLEISRVRARLDDFCNGEIDCSTH